MAGKVVTTKGNSVVSSIPVKDVLAVPAAPIEYLPRIEIIYNKSDRKQPYKVSFFNCETRSVFQKMITFTFQKALFVFRKNLILEGDNDGGE